MDVQEIESAITQLPRAQVAELAAWFEQFHAQWGAPKLNTISVVAAWISCLKKRDGTLILGRCESL